MQRDNASRSLTFIADKPCDGDDFLCFFQDCQVECQHLNHRYSFICDEIVSDSQKSILFHYEPVLDEDTCFFFNVMSIISVVLLKTLFVHSNISIDVLENKGTLN